METVYRLYLQWAAALMRASPVLRERGLKQDYESGGKRWQAVAIEMEDMGGAMCCVYGDGQSCPTSAANHCRT